MSGFQVQGITNNGDEKIKMLKDVLEKSENIILDYIIPINNSLDTIETEDFYYLIIRFLMSNSHNSHGQNHVYIQLKFHRD